MTLGTYNGVQFYLPICVERPMTIDQLSIAVASVSTPTNNCYLGLFDDDGTGNPTTLIAEVGPFSITTTGPLAQSLPAAQALAPGTTSWASACSSRRAASPSRVWCPSCRPVPRRGRPLRTARCLSCTGFSP